MFVVETTTTTDSNKHRHKSIKRETNKIRPSHADDDNGDNDNEERTFKWQKLKGKENKTWSVGRETRDGLSIKEKIE